MADKPITFNILKRQAGTLGRAGVIHTPHGDIATPAFVVVGTKGTVKSIKPEDMRDFVGNQVALANTYHLFLQPGDDVIKEAGGLHNFPIGTCQLLLTAAVFRCSLLALPLAKE
jgi:queuine tRNA-ribosyltransferase